MIIRRDQNDEDSCHGNLWSRTSLFYINYTKKSYMSLVSKNVAENYKVFLSENK